MPLGALVKAFAWMLIAWELGIVAGATVSQLRQPEPVSPVVLAGGRGR